MSNLAVGIIIVVVIIVLYYILAANADKVFIESVDAANLACETAKTSQLETDFSAAIMAITNAKTARSVSLNQYSPALETGPPAPAEVKAASDKLDGIQCGYHTLDAAAINAVTTAKAANDAALKSKSGADITTAANTYGEAKKAVAAAVAQYSKGAPYVTTALAPAIETFRFILDDIAIDAITTAKAANDIALKTKSADMITQAASLYQIALKALDSAMAQYTKDVPYINTSLVLAVGKFKSILNDIAIDAVATAKTANDTAVRTKSATDIVTANATYNAAKTALNKASAQYTGEPPFKPTLDTFKSLIVPDRIYTANITSIEIVRPDGVENMVSLTEVDVLDMSGNAIPKSSMTFTPLRGSWSFGNSSFLNNSSYITTDWSGFAEISSTGQWNDSSPSGTRCGLTIGVPSTFIGSVVLTPRNGYFGRTVGSRVNLKRADGSIAASTIVQDEDLEDYPGTQTNGGYTIKWYKLKFA